MTTSIPSQKPDPSPLQDWTDGIIVMLPLLFGVIPFGMIAGMVAAKAGMTAGPGIGQSVIIFAGAAQLAVTQLIAESASPLVVVLTGLVINLRLAMYSASLAPHFRDLPRPLRALIAYLITDQAYALCITRYQSGTAMSPAAKARYYLGGALMMWAVWLVAAALGFILGTTVPASWSLDFIVPLSFLTLLVPNIRDSATLTAALSGAFIAIVAAALPFNLGLFLGATGGIAAGYMSENISRRKGL